MSIQKKSLISTLKTAKKANVASSSTQEVDAKGAKVASMSIRHSKKGIILKQAGVSLKQTGVSLKQMKGTSLKQMKGTSQTSFRK
jgi:hypothetical protein